MNENTLVLEGKELSLSAILDASFGTTALKVSSATKARVESAATLIQEAVNNNRVIYGVTTNFGAMAQASIQHDKVAFLQENLLWGLKCGVGHALPTAHVRAAMIISANALLKGVSGIRFELIERMVLFLNHQFTPVVYEHGSIGASGDLVPMSYIAGCITGLGPQYQVMTASGEKICALEALSRINLAPITLKAKEGLALVNSTAMMTGIAVHCIKEFGTMLNLSCHANAFLMLALRCRDQSLDPFVHTQKPHPGQIQIAEKMRELIADSPFILQKDVDDDSLVQDRYSLRCIAQYLGVASDGLKTLSAQVTTEANAVTDNPLIDIDTQRILHSGNFLGEYIGVGMDQLRSYLALLIKQLDVQIALVVTPEFSNGLPGSLAADEANPVKFGLKGLQICANSLMPLILHQANPIATLYPTHAEQFNQNINSQGFSSAVLAYKSLDLARWYGAIALIFSVQAIACRSLQHFGHIRVRESLSPVLASMYETIYAVLDIPVTELTPLIFHVHAQNLDDHVRKIYTDLCRVDSQILKVMEGNSAPHAPC